MKKLVLFAGILLLIFLAACGGGAPNLGTGSAGFTNASFSGNYVFTMNGQCVACSTGTVVIQSVGVMTADGKGNISGGSWDLNIGGSDTQTAISGTYQVSSDGTATLNLSETALGISDTFEMMLTGTNGGYVVSADTAWALAGVLELQSPSAIAAAPTNAYVFRAAGVNSALAGEAVVGSMNFTSGAVVADMNNAGTFIPTGAATLTSGAYDNTVGRGTVTLTSTSALPSMSFTYYVVDGSTLEIVSNDISNGMQGRAEATAGAVGAPSGSFAFLASGYPPAATGISSSASSSVAVSEGGILTFGSGGAVSSGVIDTVFNSNGETGATFTGTGVLSTAGGVTRDLLALSVSSSTISMPSAVLWMTNSGRGFFLTTSSDRAEAGTINLQSGAPFSDGATFGFDQAGWALTSSGAFGLTSTELFKNSGGTVSGYSQGLNLATQGFSTTTGNGTLSFDSTGTIGSLVLNNTAVGTQDYRFYQYSSSSGFIMETDQGAVASGLMTMQTAQ